MSSKLQVKIYGKTYTVRETESDIPIAQLSEYVDSKMKELAGSRNLNHMIVKMWFMLQDLTGITLSKMPGAVHPTEYTIA